MAVEMPPPATLRTSAPAIEQQIEVNPHRRLDDLSNVVAVPVLWGAGARPQPRSSRMPVADKRHKFINHQHGSALVYQTP